LGFINPLLLFGLLAAFVPFLIHLWSRRQAKIIDFSSLRFLLEAHRKRVRRLQIKQWLILLLRMLIIILIVLALARPLLKNRFSFAGMRSKTSCVIILDNSYSMAYKGINGQRFEIAKEKALEVVDSLEKGDSASLILMSDNPEPVFKRLTKDLTLVRSAIKNCVLSNRTTSIPPSIKLALSILADSNDPNKEIYLITDFDQNGWQGWGNLDLDSDIRLFTIETRFDRYPENVAIQKIRFSNKLISINTPVRLEVVITNFSNSLFNDMTVTLYIDGVKRRTINVNIPAGETIVQSFTHQFNSPGTHTGKFELTTDRLSVDDVRYFAVKVYGQIKTLCVSKDPLYLSLALNPEISLSSVDNLQTAISNQSVGPKALSLRFAQGQALAVPGPISEYVFLPTVCAPDELGNTPMEEYDIVILADIADMNSSVLKRLRNFVTNGKSLLIFVSEGYKDEYNEFGLFPARLNTPLSFEPPIKIATYNEVHPIFNNVFETRHFSGEDSPSFYKAYKLEPSEDSKTIAKFNNDIPAILERKIGRGSVFLFNTNVSDLSWSNFALKPIFLPILHQTVIYAISEKENRTDAINLEVGTPFLGFYYDYPSNPVFIKNVSQDDNSPSNKLPAPTRLKSGAGSQVSVVGNNGIVKYDSTHSPGIYQIEIQGKERIKRDFFAVNIDTSESNLVAQDIDKALSKFNTKANAIETSSYADHGKLKRTLNSYRMGKEIWSELLIVAIALMFVEICLANREHYKH